MSSAAPREPGARAPQEWTELEVSVRRLLHEFEVWRRRAVDAERRLKEMEATLEYVKSGILDPLTLNETVETLRTENQDLRTRLEQANQSVNRIMTRLDFLADER